MAIDNRDIPPPNVPPSATVVALPHGRIPPHNLDAERSLLGGVLLDGMDAFREIAEQVSAEDFYRDAHRKVFEAMAALFEDGEPIDRVSVKDRLTGLGTFDDVGGEEFVDLLDKFVPTAANLAYYAEIVRDKAVARRLIEAATGIAQLGYEQHGDVAGFVEESHRRIVEIVESTTRRETNRFLNAHTTFSVEDLTTDPPPLEFILRPYIPSETVSVLSGPGGSNKTTLTSLIAVSRALGRPVFNKLYPREGETVILTTEDRKQHYRRKFAAIRECLGSEYKAAAVAERVHLLDMAGLPVRLILADRGEQFRPSHEIDELADALHRIAPKADHIVIETISRVTGGVESNAAMSVLVTACERLCTLIKIAVTLVGHVGQNTARAGIADAYAGRGGSALGDNARSSLVLMPLTQKNCDEYAAGLELSDEDFEHTLVLTQPKRNGTAASESPPRLLRRLSTRFGPVLEDASYAAAPGATAGEKPRGKRGKPAERTYDQLREAIVDVVAKKGPISGNGVFHTVGGKKTLFAGAVQDMLREGRIGRDAESRLVVPKSVPNSNELGTTTTRTAGSQIPLSPLRGEREEGIGNQLAVPELGEPANKEPPKKPGEVF